MNETVQKFSGLSPEAQKLIVIIAALAAAIGPLLVLLGTLSIMIGAISLPVVAVVAAIGLLIAAIVLIYNKWKENGERSKEILEDLYGKVQEVVDGVINFFGNLSSNAKAIWQDMWTNITTYFDGIRTRITTAMTEFTDGMLKKWDNFKGGLISIWGAITGSIKGYVNNIIGFVNRLIDALNSIQVDVPEWVPIYGGLHFGIDLSHVPLLADGGDITRKGWAVVGEQGPELLNLDAGAQVRPLDKTGGIRFERGAFEGAFIMDDYGVDRLMDRIFARLAAAGAVV